MLNVACVIGFHGEGTPLVKRVSSRPISSCSATLVSARYVRRCRLVGKHDPDCLSLHASGRTIGGSDWARFGFGEDAL